MEQGKLPKPEIAEDKLKELVIRKGQQESKGRVSQNVGELLVKKT